MLMVTDFMLNMWNYTVAWCAVTEQQAKKPSLKCYEVYTTFTCTDQQETSASESGNAAMHVPVMTGLYQWWKLVLIRISQQQHWSYHIHTNCYSKNTNNGCTITVCDDVISWHIDRISTTVWCQQLKIWYDVASTDYKNLCTCCSLTFCTVSQVAVSHIKLFHSTGAGRTRMQLAKVVIASDLVQDVKKTSWR